MKALLLTIGKKSKFSTDNFPQFSHEISFNSDALQRFVKKKYGVTLYYEKEFEFPYFTDGGFKFECEDKNWYYTFTAIPYTIIE